MQLRLVVFLFFSLLISSAFAQDTIQVTTGWNMVGSLKAGTVPEVLSTEPPGIITTNFYGYMPSEGYNSSDTLQKGFGYWVKVSEDGMIIFEGLPPDTLFISDTVVVTDTVYAADTTTCGYKKVEYGGTTYGTVQIGSQCWLDRNLNVGSWIGYVINNQTDNDTTEKYCQNSDTAFCASYGGLYLWQEAMQYDSTEGVQGICPTGWHIPTFAEFQTLSSAVGGDGNTLKALGQGTSPPGSNTTGFSALLAGNSTVSGYYDLGTTAVFWTSTYAAPYPHSMSLSDGNSNIFIWNNPNTGFGFSVRCIED